MNFLKRLSLLISLGIVVTALQAEDLPTLRIGVESFAPPFVVVGAKNVYGFDADMMQTLCNKMGRQCQFVPLPFSQLLTSVANGEVDMALSAIAITAERAKTVNFSLPYLILYHRFLTRTEMAKQPFHFDAMNGKRIAYESGTILAQLLRQFPIKDPQLIPFKHIEDEIVALSNGKVHFVLLDAPTALYWENNSAGELRTFGKPIPSNMALGIAINQQQTDLLAAVNRALTAYLEDGGFKSNYDRYLVQFSTPESPYTN